ncbi:hypothetical protein [Actinomadura oligospora]|uniref:hypothetical protein n=1 Tax=Actinomadura oligospora TaxID=111804 RepID=UPI0004B03E9C|nr:hypothetical protein [Actinomadura oligospora]
MDAHKTTTAVLAPGFSMTLAARTDGWLAMRDVDHTSSVQETSLISPDGEEAGRVRLGRFDLFNHPFEVRRSPELFFLQGRSSSKAEGTGTSSRSGSAGSIR